MINRDSLQRLYQYCSLIIGYGLNNQYLFDSIEEFISYSDMFARLEQSDSSFLTQRTINQEIAWVYKLQDSVKELPGMNSILTWVGQAYMRLFFHFHKSIYYVFLYIPIEEMLSLYSLYHEMDWNQLFDYFTQQTSKTTLLRKLLDKKKMSVNKLAQLSNISENTIRYYTLSDSNIYEAKYAYIDAIALALKVNTNLFLKNIHNYVDDGRYQSNKENPIFRSYLGLYLSSYYCGEIKNRKYIYNLNENVFECEGKYLKVLWTKTSQFADIIDGKNPDIERVLDAFVSNIPFTLRKNYVVVIFEYNMVSEFAKPYADLSKYNLDKIIIINQSNILHISQNYWGAYISDSINQTMIEKAAKITERIKQNS